MSPPASDAPPGRPGRKRDHSRDAVILDATIEVLAERGYDRMTIDEVAARATMARATVYRRWPTKADLVLEAVARLSRSDVDAEHLPDTGTLRGDMLAMTRSFDEEAQQVRIRALAGLVTLIDTDERLAAAATDAGLGPWVEVNRLLMRRAISRGEYPSGADVDTLAEVVPMLCVSRAVQRLPITREFSVAVMDGVILPALRGGADPSGPGEGD